MILEDAKQLGFEDAKAVKNPNNIQFMVTKMINTLAYNDEKGFNETFLLFQENLGKRDIPNLGFKDKDALRMYLMSLNNEILKKRKGVLVKK